MSPTDDFRRWSDELARDPTSLVFLRLSEGLRREGELALALKIALRGLERHPNHGEARELVARITADHAVFMAAKEVPPIIAPASAPPETIEGAKPASRPMGAIEQPDSPAPMPPREVPAREASLEPSLTPTPAVDRTDYQRPSLPTADLRFPTLEEAQALLIDGQGLVVAGGHRDSDGRDVGQELAAHLSGISDEAVRAARYLDLGAWRSIIIETDRAVIAIAPIGDSAVTVVTASRAMPLGMLRRVLVRCASQAVEWIGAVS